MTTNTTLVAEQGSLTYEPYFGLHEKAFSLLPNPKFFFRAPPHQAAFDALRAGIRRNEGILVLTGEPGTGKTTLCRAVLDGLDRKTFASFVRDPIVTREDLLKTLLVDFGVVSIDQIRAGHLRGASRTELSYPLYEFLTSLQPLDAFALVMIDEAQNIPVALLEELRILSDLENGQSLLQLMLVGQPELDARLALQEMRQLTQRVTVRCELTPLTAGDVELYITHRLLVAGTGKAGFSEGALRLIAAVSAGVPRVVNLLCDRAMTRAAEADEYSISAVHVIAAVNDLRLPKPTDSIFWGSGDASPRPSTNQRVGDPDAHTPLPDSTVDVDPTEQLAASVERVAPPEASGLGLFVGTSDDVTDDPAQQSRWRLIYIGAALAVLVIVATSVWLSRRQQAPAVSNVQSNVQSTAARADAPPLTTSVPPVTTSVPPAPPAVAPSEPPAQTPAPAASNGPFDPAAAEGQFVVQMATFRFETNAARSVQEFRDAGFPAYTIASALGGDDRGFAVFVGPYPGLKDAERERERAQQLPGYGAGRIVRIASSASVR